MPGLFLAGSALVRYGVVERMERSTSVPAMLGLVFAAGAALWRRATWGAPAAGDRTSS